MEAYIAERHPQLKNIVDLGIYTKDREFRLPGSTKYGKSSVLAPVNPDTPFSDARISWLDSPEECRVIEVPVPFSVNVNKRKRVQPPTPAQEEEEQQENRQDDASTRARILELVQAKVLGWTDSHLSHQNSLLPP